ncbi:hypothetical protein ACERK3_07830 [Phycisphaerales bacterium AB-hyl4]|uniref:RIO1 family protein n=1 Tax=Natronomicrosphaera hydrolytica TaxID=3242702 RepID=A0ABV4U3P3_9BACT
MSYKGFQDLVERLQEQLIEKDARAIGGSWNELLEQLDIPDAKLLWRQPNRPWRRTYAYGERIYKISHYGIKGVGDPELKHEYDAFQACASITGIPKAMGYHSSESAEVAVYSRVRDRRLYEFQPTVVQSFVILFRLGVILWRVSWRGVAHNDITANNLLVGSSRSVTLVDFDRASFVPRTTAFYRNFVKRCDHLNGFNGSFQRVMQNTIATLLPPRVAAAGRHMLNRLFRSRGVGANHHVR